MITIYLIDQYGQRRAWATGSTYDDAQAILQADVDHYRATRPDLRMGMACEGMRDASAT